MVGIGKYIKGKSFSKMFAKKSPFSLISVGLINAPQSSKYKSDDDTDVDIDASQRTKITDKSKRIDKSRIKGGRGGVNV